MTDQTNETQLVTVADGVHVWIGAGAQYVHLQRYAEWRAGRWAHGVPYLRVM